MSETTRKLRKFGEGCEGHKLIDWYHMYLGMELAADAIEAVEAQVAEAVARVAALEKRTVAQIPQECPACTGEDAGTARGGTGAAARSVPNAEGSPAGSTSPPASSAVTAPRGFKKGDVVRTGGLSPFDAVVVEVREPQRENWNVTIKSDRGTYEWHGPDLTLVRAAAAPEAPAEDAGLVERLARIIVDTPCAANHEGQCIPPGAPVDDCDRANARAVLSDLTAESRLCAPGEVARLKDELAEANGARFLNANAVRLQKARAEAAEKELAEARAISAATAERVRNETQIATELRKDLDDLRAKLATAEQAIDVERNAHASTRTALVGSRGQVEMVTQDRRAIIDGAEKERDALRAELDKHQETERMRLCAISVAAGCNTPESAAKQRIAAGNPYWTLAYGDVCAAVDREMSLRAKLAALRAKLAAAEKAHAELLKARMECASRADGYIRERDALRAELDAAQGEMRSLRVTISVLRADLAALKDQRDAQTRSYDRVAAECDALRLASLTWFNAAGEPELLATAEEVTERRKAAAKELAALRSKPRFRTRKVTKADVEDFIAHDGCFYESLRALGFRRRVDGAK